MKKLMLLGVLAVAAAAQADNTHKLTKLWESEAALKVPESVYFDAARKVLYVSNIDGEPWAADGKGSIAKMGLDGRIIAAEWITGLECPKGLALSDDGKWLYVGDHGGLVVIDVDAGKISRKIAIEGGLLNDVVNHEGTIYASDSKGAKVYVFEDGKPAVFLDGKVLKGPNGLQSHEGSLYVLDNDALHRVEKDKSLKLIAEGMPGGVDGLENVQGDDFLVSVWSGAVWYVKGDGGKELLFDGKAVQTRTADLGWDPATKTAYVPTFFGNTVIAFKVE